MALILFVLVVQASGGGDLPMFGKAAVGFSVAVVSLSLALAWTVAKKARSEWRQLAKEWAESKEFTEAVNTARAPLTRELILETDGKIRAAIEAHNRDDDAHRKLRGHDSKNTDAKILATDERRERNVQREMERLAQRIAAVETEIEAMGRRRK